MASEGVEKARKAPARVLTRDLRIQRFAKAKSSLLKWHTREGTGDGKSQRKGLNARSASREKQLKRGACFLVKARKTPGRTRDLIRLKTVADF